jgi:hypothetical protein
MFEQARLISSRESLGHFGVPCGPAASVSPARRRPVLRSALSGHARSASDDAEATLPLSCGARLSVDAAPPTAVSVPTRVILVTAFSLLVYPSHRLAQYIFYMCIDCVTKSCGWSINDMKDEQMNRETKLPVLDRPRAQSRTMRWGCEAGPASAESAQMPPRTLAGFHPESDFPVGDGRQVHVGVYNMLVRAPT